MNEVYPLPADDSGDLLYRRIYLLVSKDVWGWPSIGAVCGLAGGLLSVILGGLLWVVVRLLATGVFGALLNRVELVFFVLTLPLLALGAHCLDLLEQARPLRKN